MASRNFSRVQGLNKEVKIIAGRFDDQDVVQAGLGFSGANTGTGIYVVTLQDAYPYLLSAQAQIQSTTGADDYSVTVAAFDVSASSKTVTLHVHKAAILTDLGVGDQIHFALFLQNSTVPSK